MTPCSPIFICRYSIATKPPFFRQPCSAPVAPTGDWKTSRGPKNRSTIWSPPTRIPPKRRRRRCSCAKYKRPNELSIYETKTPLRRSVPVIRFLHPCFAFACPIRFSVAGGGRARQDPLGTNQRGRLGYGANRPLFHCDSLPDRRRNHAHRSEKGRSTRARTKSEGVVSQWRLRHGLQFHQRKPIAP